MISGKALVVLFLFVAIGMLLYCCKEQAKTNNYFCNASEIHFFHDQDTLELDMRSFLKKVYEVQSFDSLYLFTPYTFSDTIKAHLNCYDKEFTYITDDDRYYLIILKEDSDIYYGRVGRRLLKIGKNTFYSIKDTAN